MNSRLFVVAALGVSVAVGGCASIARASHCVGEPDLDIWVSDTSGSATRLVDEEGADGFADWSPDGERIAFVASRDGNCEIYQMDADGSGQMNLTNTRTDELHPSWSPGGSQIVYAAEGQLHILDVLSGQQTQLTTSDLIHAFPDWSPDGGSIVFSGGAEPAGPGVAHQIYVVGVSGGLERQLTHGDVLLAAPKWSPDGSQIAYFDHGDPFEVWVMNVDSGNVDAVTEGGHSAWSPDGSSLVHDREVGPRDVDLFIAGELFVDSPGFDTLPSWSPDGSSIAFSSDRP